VGAKAPIGTIYGISYVNSYRPAVVATSPEGTAWSRDEGTTWHTIDGLQGFWAVAFTERSVGWLVGTDGQIVKISF
jgi:hypothetical protein